jgi:hypothetical protein
MTKFKCPMGNTAVLAFRHSDFIDHVDLGIQDLETERGLLG